MFETAEHGHDKTVLHATGVRYCSLRNLYYFIQFLKPLFSHKNSYENQHLEIKTMSVNAWLKWQMVKISIVLY